MSKRERGLSEGSVKRGNPIMEAAASDGPVIIGDHVVGETPLEVDCSVFHPGFFPYGKVVRAMEEYLEKNPSEPDRFAFFMRIKMIDPKRCKGAINIGRVRHEQDGACTYVRLRTADDKGVLLYPTRDTITRTDRTELALEEDTGKIVNLHTQGHLKITGVHVGKKQ